MLKNDTERVLLQKSPGNGGHGGVRPPILAQNVEHPGAAAGPLAPLAAPAPQGMVSLIGRGSGAQPRCGGLGAPAPSQSRVPIGITGGKVWPAGRPPGSLCSLLRPSRSPPLAAAPHPGAQPAPDAETDLFG